MSTFTLNYCVTGSEHKRLVTAIAEITECTVKYKGAPIMQRKPICEEYG